MKLKILKTKQDYEKALSEFEKLFDAKKGTPEGDKAELFALLIEQYDKKHYPIDEPDPIEFLKYKMEHTNLKQKDLVSAIGHKSRVSDILNRKRKLTLKMIRNLYYKLNIPAEILISDYKLADKV